MQVMFTSAAGKVVQKPMTSGSGKKRKQPGLNSHISGYDDEECMAALEDNMLASSEQGTDQQSFPSETTHMLGPGEAHVFSNPTCVGLLCEWCSCRFRVDPKRHRDAEMFSGETAMLRGAVALLVMCFLFCTSAFVISATRYGLDLSDEYGVWFSSNDSSRNSTLSLEGGASSPSSSSHLPISQVLVMERIESMYHNLTGT